MGNPEAVRVRPVLGSGGSAAATPDGKLPTTMNSPSAAGAIVLARNVNGRLDWQTDAGESYHAWSERKLGVVTSDDADGPD